MSAFSCALKTSPARTLEHTYEPVLPRGFKEEWMTSMYSLRPASHVSKYFPAFCRVTNACRSRHFFHSKDSPLSYPGSAVSYAHEKTVLCSPALPDCNSGILLRASPPRAVPALRRRKMLWSLPVRPQRQGWREKLTSSSQKKRHTVCTICLFFFSGALVSGLPPHQRAPWKHAPRPCGHSWRT